MLGVGSYGCGGDFMEIFLNLRDVKGCGFDLERDLTEKAWNQT